jgi:hypothetical protein
MGTSDALSTAMHRFWFPQQALFSPDDMISCSWLEPSGWGAVEL